MSDEPAQPGIMDGKRKFGLSLLIIALSSSMVFLGKMEASAWVTIATLALSIYSGANVVDKKLGGAG